MSRPRMCWAVTAARLQPIPQRRALPPRILLTTGQADFGNNRRNSFFGPRYADTDLSLYKKFVTRERFTVQLGAKPTTFSITPTLRYPGETFSPVPARSPRLRLPQRFHMDRSKMLVSAVVRCRFSGRLLSNLTGRT